MKPIALVGPKPASNEITEPGTGPRPDFSDQATLPEAGDTVAAPAAAADKADCEAARAWDDAGSDAPDASRADDDAGVAVGAQADDAVSGDGSEEEDDGEESSSEPGEARADGEDEAAEGDDDFADEQDSDQGDTRFADDEQDGDEGDARFADDEQDSNQGDAAFADDEQDSDEGDTRFADDEQDSDEGDAAFADDEQDSDEGDVRFADDEQDSDELTAPNALAAATRRRYGFTAADFADREELETAAGYNPVAFDDVEPSVVLGDALLAGSSHHAERSQRPQSFQDNAAELGDLPLALIGMLVAAVGGASALIVLLLHHPAPQPRVAADAPPIVAFTDVRAATAPKASTQPSASASQPEAAEAHAAEPQSSGSTENAEGAQTAEAAAEAAPKGTPPSPREISQMEKIRATFEHNKGLAYRMIHSTPRAWRTSSLAEEREGLAAIALFSLAPRARARAAATRFVAHHPSSPLRPRLEQLLAARK